MKYEEPLGKTISDLEGENMALRFAIEGLLIHCVRVDGFPESGKGRTEIQQKAYDLARELVRK